MPARWVLACKRQWTTAITTVWSESFVWQPTSKTAIEQWRPTAIQKRLYLHHQGEFQHNYYVIVSLHDGDHDGVVRISVDLSCVLRGLIRLFIYVAQFFPYQECNYAILRCSQKHQLYFVISYLIDYAWHSAYTIIITTDSPILEEDCNGL